jgi:hypothetical protein
VAHKQCGTWAEAWVLQKVEGEQGKQLGALVDQQHLAQHQLKECLVEE